MENNNNKRNGRKTVRQVKPVGVWLCPLPLRIIVTSSHPGRRRDQKFLFASAFLIFQHAQGKPEKKRLTCRFASGLGGWAGLLVWGRAGGGTNNNFRRLWNNLCTYDNVSWRILRAILDDIYWAIVCPSLTQKTNKQQTSSIHPPPSPCGFDKAADESGRVVWGLTMLGDTTDSRRTKQTDSSRRRHDRSQGSSSRDSQIFIFTATTLGCCFCCRPSYLITIRSIPAHHNLLLSPPVSQMTELWSRFDESKKVNPFLHPWRYKNKFNWC